MPDVRGVQSTREGHCSEYKDPHCADAKLEHPVHPQRMLTRRNKSRQQKTAQTHSTHEGPEQNAERNGGRPDDELQQLEPHNLVDEGCASASDEEEQECRHRRDNTKKSGAKRGKEPASLVQGLGEWGTGKPNGEQENHGQARLPS